MPPQHRQQQIATRCVSTSQAAFPYRIRLAGDRTEPATGHFGQMEELGAEAAAQP